MTKIDIGRIRKGIIRALRVSVRLPKRQKRHQSTHSQGLRQYMKSTRQRLSYAVMSVLMVVSIVLPFINIEPAQALQTPHVVDSDITTQWIPSTGTTHFELVNENTSNVNTADYISTGTAGSGGEIAEFGLGDPSNVDTVSNVTIYIYAYSATNANGGSLDTVGINLYINGAYQTVSTVTPTYSATGEHAWYNASFNGSWTQAQINAAQAYLVHNRVGSGAPTSQDDDVRVAAVYADITYTQSTTFDQSSYRWFENEDAAGPATFALSWGGAGTDSAHDVVVDESGNIYTVGNTASTGLTAGGIDQSIVKYNPNGVEQWSKTWGGTSDDEAWGVALDTTGNVYVVGVTASTGLTAGGIDQTLVKYSPDGVEQWSKTWGGTSTDYAEEIEIDSSGNIYVVGYSNSSGYTSGNYDQTLVKYNSSGVEQWSKTWGDSTGNEYGLDVALDFAGNIYTVGYTNSTNFAVGDHDQFLVKYNASGEEQWSKTWGDTSFEAAYALEIDDSANIYVVGEAMSTGYTSGLSDQTLVKYNSSGVEQWSKTWGGSDEYDRARAMDMDSSGNIYVVGETASTGLTAGGIDQTMVKYDSAGIEQWSKTWGGTTDDKAYSVFVSDSSGYIYVGGNAASSGFSSGGVDQTLLALDSSGTITNCTDCVDRTASEVDRTVSETDHTTAEVDRAVSETDRATAEVNRESPQVLVQCGSPLVSYLHTWGDTGAEEAADIAIDSSGNMYVVGQTASTGFTAGGADQTLVKYNSSGVEQWSKTWGGTGDDKAWGVALDSVGNIYVSGQTASTGFTAGGADQTLVKYDSNGVEQWSSTWGGSGSDFAEELVIDSQDNIYVAGYSNSTGFTSGDYDQTLVKYNSSGVEQWSKTWGGASGDYAIGVTVDLSTDDIYLIGQTYSFSVGVTDFNLVKFNSSGVEQWSKTWGGDGNEAGFAGRVDDSGNIYVVAQTASTGFTTGGFDQALVKFNSSGVEQWSKTWGGTGDDKPRGIALGDDGIYVTGETASTTLSSGGVDQNLVKYSYDGVEQWSKTWGGDGTDVGYEIGIDSTGNIFVVGVTASTGLTAGGNDQTLFKTTSEPYDCAGVCELRSTSEVDRTTSEVDRTTSEVDRTTSEASRTTSEVNRTTTEILRNETLDTIFVDVANPLATVNTAANAPAEGTPFRLRMNLHVNTAQADPASATFKLQYAARGADNVCDTSFTNETYADLSPSSGPIRFYNNTNAIDGQPLATNANDPTHSTDDLVRQSYEESNNFTVANAIPAGDDGMWDFALVDAMAPASTTYCFRAVTSAGTVLNNYTVVPQITTAASTLSQASFRAYENKSPDIPYFINGLGGDGNDSARALALDSSGNIYVAGYTASTGLTAGSNDQTLVKYDSSGTEVWSKTWGGTGSDAANALALDPSGNIYVVGETTSAEFSAGIVDQTLVKYDSSGNEIWSKTWGGTNFDIAYALAFDSVGNIYVAGYTASTGLTAGGSDQTLVKYDSSGTEVWSKTWGGTGSDIAYDLALDSSGNIYVAGSTASTGLTSGGIDQTLVKYDSVGDEIWSKTWGGAGTDYAYSLALDSSDNIYVAGRTDSTGLTAGGSDQTLVKYNPSGVEQWSKTWGDDGTDIARALALDSSDNIYVAGETSSTGLTASGSDQTLVKYNSSGVEQWSKTWGGDGNDIAYALAFDSVGNIYVAGYTASTGMTAGGFDQTVWKSTPDASDCIGVCTLRTDVTTIVDRTSVTVIVDRTSVTVIEDRTSVTVIEDRTVTEVDRTGVATITEIYVPKTFAKAWGGSSSEYGKSVIQTSDGGYATVGTSGSSAVVTKYTISGEVTWQRSWSYHSMLFVYSSTSIVEADDGGFVIVVTSGDDWSLNNFYSYIIKLSSSGALSWDYQWGSTAYDEGYSIAKTSDGGYAVTGYTASYGAGSTDMFLAKYSSTGGLSWSRTWGDAGSEGGRSLVQTSDDGYIITGDDGSDMFIAKFTSDGTHSWSRTWGGAGTDSGKSVVQTSDGGYIVTGDTTSYSAGSTDMFLAKYDSSGTLSWSRTWGGAGADDGNSVIQTSDGGYAIAGSTASYGAGSTDLFITKYDSSGTLSWSRTWGGTGVDYGKSIVQTTDGGYVVTGDTASYGGGGADILIHKFDAYGDIVNCSSTNCSSPAVYIDSPTVTSATASVSTPSSPSMLPTSPTVSVGTPSGSITSIVTATPISYLQNGTALAAVDTRAELLETDMDFRLRIGLLASGKKYTGTGTFKIQSGVYTGTCDPSTTSYSDVSGATSPIAFYDNSFAATGDKVHPDTTNPVVTGTRETMQTYIEANTFNNPRQMDINDTGIWDFALKADGAKIGRTYCFRIVESGASLNGGYSQYAEVYIPPTMGDVMRHGTFFNTQNTQQPFAWGRE